MLEVVFDNAKVFKDCVDALVTLIDEGEFEFSKDGIRLAAMDPSQIAMVNFFLPKTALQKYELKKDVVKVGVNLQDLAKITSRYRPEEKLTLKLGEDKPRLNLVFKGKHSRRFNLPLIDVSASAPKQPKIEFDSKIKILGGVLKESLKDALLVSSHVVLRTDKTAFFIEANGDKGEVFIETTKGEDALLEHTINTDSRAVFPLEYLNDLLKTAENETPITIDLKTDAPLRLEYSIDNATVTYYLAPRIENA